MYVQPYFPQLTPIMQRPKQDEKQAKQKPYEPTPLDYQLLQYVRDYHFLTAWQLVKLHYSDVSSRSKNWELSYKAQKIALSAYIGRRV